MNHPQKYEDFIAKYFNQVKLSPQKSLVVNSLQQQRHLQQSLGKSMERFKAKVQ